MPTLPYPNAADVKVFSNEYINVNTMNRALLRLFYNDDYLAGLSSLSPVDAPTVANMMIVSTGPGTYTWKTDTQAKTLLNITDSVFGLVDVDEDSANMLNNYCLFWDASKDAFVGAQGVKTLDNLDDVTISSPSNLQSIIYSSEYGKFINAFPDTFTVGYVTHVTLEEDGKVLLPEITTVGQQVVVTKIGTSTDIYIVPNSSNKINGQSAKSLRSNNSTELVSTIHIRSVLKDDSSVEWITMSGDGTFDFYDTSLVPGSSIVVRSLTDDDLMLAPYEVSVSGVPDASQLIKGIIRIATDVETQTGTATDLAVTPQGVKWWFDNYATPFATDIEFAAGTSTGTAITPAQIHMFDTEYIPFTSHDTYALTYSDVDVAYEYDIAEFNGTDLNTNEIRTIYISTYIRSGPYATNEISVTMPDGTDVAIAYANSPDGNDETNSKLVFPLPINKGQTSITITMSGTGSRTFTLLGAAQRVFDN